MEGRNFIQKMVFLENKHGSSMENELEREGTETGRAVRINLQMSTDTLLSSAFSVFLLRYAAITTRGNLSDSEVLHDPSTDKMGFVHVILPPLPVIQ